MLSERSTIEKLLFLKAAVPSEPGEKTVVGNPVSFRTKYAEPMKLVIPFSPVQSFNGYDHPWPGGGGKNLYDKDSSVKDYFINGSGAIVASSPGNTANGEYSELIPVTAGQQYTLSFEKTTGVVWNVRIHAYNSQGTWLQQIDAIAADSNTSYTKTVEIPSGAANVRLSLNYERIAKVQFEPGSSATSYVPYSNVCPITGWTEANISVSPTQDAQDATVYPVAFGSTYYGGNLTVNADGTGELVVDTAFYEFDGSEDESWSISTSSSNIYRFGSIVVAAYNADERLNAVGSSLPCVSITIAGSEIGFSLNANNQLRIRYGLFETLTVSELKTYLSQNPLQVAYKINNPQTVSLSPGLVKSIIGQNNVWTDTNGENTVAYIK